MLRQVQARKKSVSNDGSARTALTLLLVLGSFMANNESIEENSRAIPGVYDFVLLSGLIVLSTFMAHFHFVSQSAALFANFIFGALVFGTISITQTNGVQIQQAIAALAFGVSLSYGLFSRSGITKDVIEFPFICTLALALHELEMPVTDVLSVFLFMEAILRVVRQWTNNPLTPILTLVFMATIDVGFKVFNEKVK